ncbi:MAG: PQQ-binding-like beta-propeller repeat protein, partial [Planctomycetaceae bacterium]|nr:PQQ-binding-like beta-propeller repeat protein [Planctomycetaceae bacterium]
RDQVGWQYTAPLDLLLRRQILISTGIFAPGILSAETEIELPEGLEPPELPEADADTDEIPWTTWQPAIDNDRIYVRSRTGVTAIRIADGSPQWDYVAHGVAGTIQDFVPGDFGDPDRDPDNDFFSGMQLLQDHVGTGVVTADQHAVCFMTEINASDDAIMQFRGRFRGKQPTPCSQLIALEKTTGRRLWTLGNRSPEEPATHGPGCVWFFGPPVSDGKRFWTVYENADGQWLMPVAPESGVPGSPVFLCQPKVSAQSSGRRRHRGVQIVPRDGLIWVCNLEWVMAIAADSGRLLWAFPMTDSGPVDGEETPGMMRWWRSMGEERESHVDLVMPRPPIVTDQLLITTDAGNRDLLCLDPISGRLRRRMTELGLHHLLAGSDESVYVAATRQVMCIDPASGETRWSQPLHVPAEHIVGTSIRNGNSLLLPLRSGRVLTLNATDGTRTDQPAWWTVSCRQREFQTPSDCGSWGNLLVADQRLLWYSPEGMQLLAEHAPAADTQEQLESLSKQLEMGQAAEVLAQLNQLQPGVAEQTRVASLRFAALSQLAAQGNSTDEILRQLQEIAETPGQRAVLFELQMKQQQKNASATGELALLSAGLRLPSTVLSAASSAPLPEIPPVSSSADGE